MANNPNTLPKVVKLSQEQLSIIAGGGTVTKGTDTFTADEDTIYVTPDTSLSYESQSLSSAQQLQARTNIGAGTSNFSGSYNDLSNKPTIPTTTGTVTNGSTAALTSGGAYSALNLKADKTIVADYTLSAANWSSNQYTLSVTGKTATNNARVGNSNSGANNAAVLANAQAISDANIYRIVDNGTSLTFVCETTPTVDLLITVEVYE